MLIVPAGDPRRMARARELDMPGFMLDLEDAVATSRKAAARQAVRDLLAEWSPSRPPVHVRINGLSSGLALDDLLTVVVPNLSGVLVPKVESARDVQIVDWLIGSVEVRTGVAPGTVAISALIETARGLSAVREIAGSSPRLVRLCFGVVDLGADLGVDLQAGEGTPQRPADVEAFTVALKAQLVLASREFGLMPPNDGVYGRYRDLDGLRESTRRIRDLGFGGRASIHPDQVAVIEEVFAPSQRQLAWATRVRDSFAEQERTGRAAFGLDGELVDYAHVRIAADVLRRHGEMTTSADSITQMEG